MPNDPITVYACDTGEPAVMHSIDAAEAVRLGHYAYAAPEGKAEDTDALSRARARFMGGGLDQAELKSPEQRAADTERANQAEAQRQAPPVVVQVAPSTTSGATSEATPTPARARHTPPPRE